VIAAIAMRDYSFAMIPELRWLRSFLAVADEMHFSRAARKLNLAQPALTAQIRQLEDAVGAKLFERTNRMGGLTAAGRALLTEARTIVQHADSLTRTVQNAARGESGILRLGLIPPAATPAVADSLRRFAAKFPAIEIQVRQADQDKLLGRLTDSSLDLVLGRPEDSFRSRRLFVEEQGIVLREDDPRAGQSRIPIKSLASSPLLLLRGNPHFGQLLIEHAAKHDVTLRAQHVAEDFPSLYWLVRAGLGIAPVSLLLSDGLSRGLVAKPLKPSPPKLEVHALWRGTIPSPTAARWLQLAGKPFA
jgi:DNA-binding transcriptional LysR family regulator